MGAEIDRLEVQVEAQATKANNQLDKLAMRLDRVSKALSGLNSHGLSGLSDSVSKFAQASAQLSNVKTAEFTRLTKNIEKLSSLNTQQIYGASSAMHTLATAMNTLGNSSKNSTQVIQLANSLARLNSQEAKVVTTGNSLNNSINRIGIAMERTTRKARSFSNVMGNIQRASYQIARAGSKLWDSVKASMSYVEVLNYFDSAFGQVAESAVSQWKKAGTDSAQTYYNSFSDRAKQLTTKMTGFTITESGMLQSTGSKSLGINPSQLMNYQAMFAQMSNSMGMTAETSLKVSTALTEIGADLASVKNMNFDKVWNDMASGLAGMSRTLDKYGVNIRNVNLQQKLTELGINANISALNQNEKALLRTIILLDSTRYAWADLSTTIDKPANQLRLLQANFANLARTIGNIFLPIVAKVLPYLNAVVIALQRLAEWIVKLLGFEDFEWGGSGGIGGAEFDDLIGGIGDTEDSLNSTSEAAKKLKTHLLGIDELNVVNNDEDSGSSIIGGLGGSSGLLEGALDKILEEYQKAWDEAFANMEDRLDDFADKVAKAFKEGGLFGVGRLFSEMLTDALNSIPWESIYEGARKFGTGLAEFLNGLITPELFGAVGRTIAGALNTAIYVVLSFGEEFDFYDFGVSIATGINNFFEKFDFGSLAETLNVWVDGLENTIAGFLKTINGEDIINKVGDFIGDLELDTLTLIIGALALKFGKGVTDGVLKTVVDAIFGEGIASLIPGIGGTITAALTLTVAFDFIFASQAKPEGMTTGEFQYWRNEQIDKSNVSPLFPMVDSQSFMDAFNLIKESWDSIWGTTEGEERINAINYVDSESFISAFGIIKEKIDNTFGTAVENENRISATTYVDFESFSDVFNQIGTLIDTWWTDNISPYFNSEMWYILAEGIRLGLEMKWAEITEWWQNTAIYTWWTENVEPWFTAETWQTMLNNVKTSFKTKWDETANQWKTNIKKWWDEHVAPWFTKERWLTLGENLKNGIFDGFKGLANKVVDVLNNVISALEGMINTAIEGLNKFLNKISESKLGEHLGIDLRIGNVSFGRIPKFAQGGIVDRPTLGIFGEQGREAVVPLERNTEWIDSIAEQINNTGNNYSEELLREQNTLLREQNELLSYLANKEIVASIDPTRETVRGLREAEMRYGFSFT